MDRYTSVVHDLRALPGRFQLDLEPPPDSSTFADLVTDSALMRELINTEAGRVGAEEGQVAASMLVQRTAMILGGATLAADLFPAPCQSQMPHLFTSLLPSPDR